MVFRDNIWELFSILLLFLIFSFAEKYVAESLMVPDEIVADLYSKYKEAVLDEKLNTSSRRLLTTDKQFEIHVKKLKEVNGFKKHNLMIKENLRSGNGNHNSLIYINNPVESKIPNAFLTLEEFKKVLTNRILLQRNELTMGKHPNILLQNVKPTTSLRNKKKPLTIIKKAVEKPEKTTLNTYKAKPNDTTTSKNITVEFKNYVTSKTPILLRTSKIVMTSSNTEETKVKIENSTKETKSTTSLKEVMSKITTQSEGVTLTLNNYTESTTDSTKLLIIENITKLNSYKAETETFRPSDDFELVSNSNLLIDLVTNSEKKPSQDANITEKLMNLLKNSDETKELNTDTRIATSSESTFKTTPEYTTNVTTKKPAQTVTKIVTVEVTRKKYKPKRTMIQKVSFGTSKNIKGTSKKRSTLSRPLVFMGM